MCVATTRGHRPTAGTSVSSLLGRSWVVSSTATRPRHVWEGCGGTVEIVDGRTALSMDELRAKRAESQAVEVGLSYLRRLAQGRLDIVAAEQRRRAEGGEPVDHDHLVESLSDIL